MSAGPTPWGGAANGEPQGAARRAAGTPHTPHRLGVTCAAAILMLLVAVTLALAGCGSASKASSGASGGSSEIKVFAAASLTDAFTKLGAQFTAAHPDVKVSFNFAGSSDLVTQIQQGAPADVLATADTSNMDKVAALVGTAQPFAGNKLEIAVQPGNPKSIKSLADLARSDLKVVLGAPELPAGKYANKMLAAQNITVKPVSLEDSVKGVVTKVSLGEADAGIVYVTDVAAAAGKIDGVQIPDAQNVIATYPIAAVKASKQSSSAQAFVDYVLSSAGRQVLASFGFLPPAQK